MIDKKVWVTRQPKEEQGDGVIISTSKPRKNIAKTRYSYYGGWMHQLDMSYRKFHKQGGMVIKPGETKQVRMQFDFCDI